MNGFGPELTRLMARRLMFLLLAGGFAGLAVGVGIGVWLS
jgi:hypothetical protein